MVATIFSMVIAVVVILFVVSDVRQVLQQARRHMLPNLFLLEVVEKAGRRAKGRNRVGPARADEEQEDVTESRL